MITQAATISKKVLQLTVLRDLALEIAKTRDLDDLSRLVTRQTAELTQAAESAMLWLNARTGDRDYRTMQFPDLSAHVPPAVESILLKVMKKSRSLRTDAFLEKNLAAVPIRLGGRSIGALAVMNRGEGRFTAEDESHLTTIAGHVASSIENAWLHQASQKRLSEMSTLVEISQAISTSLDQGLLFERIAGKLFETTGVDEFALSIWDRERDRVVSLLDKAPKTDAEIEDAGVTYSLADYPATRRVLESRTGIAVHIDDPTADANERKFLTERRRTAVLIVPLVVRNESMGIMEIYQVTAVTDLGSQLPLFQGIANQIAAALENIRLFEETRRHAEDLERHVNERTSQLERLYQQQAELARLETEQRRLVETLREAGAIVAANLDLNRAIQELLTQLARVVPHDSASVQLLEFGELVIVGGGGWVVARSMHGYRFPIPGPNPNTKVILGKRPVILNADSLVEYEEFRKSTHGQIQSWLGVPLIAHESVIGMLTLDSREPDYFTNNHANLAIAFADQVAVAIEQAVLFEKTQAALNERDALRAIIADITDELDLSKLLNSVLVRACELLDAGSGEIGLYDEAAETVEIVADYNMGSDFIRDHIHLGKGAIGRTAELKEALIIDDYAKWPHALPEYQRNPWQAVMTAPLTYHQRLIGVIAIADQRIDKSFSVSDLALFQMFAHQASIAIENAQLFKQVQHLATIDDLTGLANRRELFRIGKELFEEALSEGLFLSTVMLDIDLFKIVNDTYGHTIGDQVLQRLAELCKTRIRNVDLLCRYGGEEFILILPRTGLDEASQIARRLRAFVEATPIHTDAGPIEITLSVGVAELSGHHGSIAALIDAADAAMYRAKDLGRNRVEAI